MEEEENIIRFSDEVNEQQQQEQQQTPIHNETSTLATKNDQSISSSTEDSTDENNPFISSSEDDDIIIWWEPKQGDFILVDSDSEDDCVMVSDLPNNSEPRKPGNRKNIKLSNGVNQKKELLEKKSQKYAKKHRKEESVLPLSDEERQLFANSFQQLLKNFREQREKHNMKMSKRQQKRLLREREIAKKTDSFLGNTQGGESGNQLKRKYPHQQQRQQQQEANPTQLLRSAGAVRMISRNALPPTSRNSSKLCPLSQSFRQFFDLTDAREHEEELPSWRQLEQEQNDCLEMYPKAQQNRKLGENNIGYRLLVANGWNGKSGLGRYEQGIENPIVPTVVQGRHGLYSQSEAGNPWK